MGAVRLAEDPELGRSLAVKTLRHVSAAATDQFLEEAQITAQLEHPNIVPVHDVGRDEAGRPWLAMKRIEGDSLDAVIAEWRKHGTRGRLGTGDYATILTVFNKVCDAVAFAHSRGVIHRDIKPANVMVGAFGEVLLVDWGLAKPIGRPDTKRTVQSSRRTDGDVTVSGDVFGTPAYMSPEQARGQVESVDERSDVFGLGALLYHMVTLHPPYSGRTLPDTLTNAARRALVPPRRRAPSHRISRDLESIILKAMDEHPEERYQSVRQLQEDLAAWRAYRRTTARRAGLAEAALKWSRRHPMVTFVTGVAAVFLAVIVLLTTRALDADRSAEIARLRAEREAADRGRAEAEARAARLRVHEATSERDAARDLAARVGEAAWNRLEQRTKHRIAAFRSAWEVARSAGESDQHFWRQYSREELRGLSEAYDELFLAMNACAEQPAPRQYLDRAAVRKAAGDHEGAIADCNAAIEIEPSYDAYWSKAFTYAVLERHEEAVVAYTSAIALDQSIPWLFNGRAASLVQMGRIDDALADASRAVQMAPDQGLLYVTRAEARAAAGDEAGALADFNRAVRLEPNASVARFNRANFFADTGDLENAISDFNWVVEHDPTIDVFVNRGAALIRLGEHRRALHDYETVLHMDPDSTHGLGGRATCRLQLDDLDGAEADACRALAIDPNLAQVRYTLGGVMAKKGDLRAAIEEYTAGIEADPDHSGCWNERGLVRFSLGEYEGAIRDFTNAIRIDPADETSWADRANCHFALGNHDEALKNYNRASELGLATPQFYTNRGMLHSAAGRNEAAVKDFCSGLVLDPESFDCLLGRAQALSALGRYSPAMEDCARALTIRPDDPYAVLTRGVLRSEAGNQDGAIADFTLVINAGADFAWQRRLNLRELAFRLRALTYHELREGERALADINRALELDSANASSYTIRASILASLDRIDHADQDVDRATRLGLDASSVAYARACVRAIEAAALPLGASRDAVVDVALDQLEKAISSGYTNTAGISKDEDLAALRDNPRFKTLVDRLR